MTCRKGESEILSNLNKPVVLRIAIEPNKTLDDVMAIARTEGRKALHCDVDVIDIDRRSDRLFWVEVRPRRKVSPPRCRGMQDVTSDP